MLPNKTRPLPPLLSQVIQNEKQFPLPTILELSDHSSPVQGGRKLVLVVKKVNENELEVVFEQVDQGIVMEGLKSARIGECQQRVRIEER